MKKIIILIVFILFLSILFISCDNDETDIVEPPKSSVQYKITGSGVADIGYIDDNGDEIEKLPWEISFQPKFAKGTTMGFAAVCDCEMEAQLLIDDEIADFDDGRGVSIYLKY